MKLALIGYMGSGKSTVSELLAHKLQLKYVDLDHEISLKNQASIPEIFSKKGEIYFRKQENLLLQTIISKEDFVLACGGGTVMYYDNLELLTQNTQTIYLAANASFLAKRLYKDRFHRPLLQHLKTEEELLQFIQIHLFERQSYYEQAKLKINIEGKTPEEIVTEIILRNPK